MSFLCFVGPEEYLMINDAWLVWHVFKYSKTYWIVLTSIFFWGDKVYQIWTGIEKKRNKPFFFRVKSDPVGAFGTSDVQPGYLSNVMEDGCVFFPRKQLTIRATSSDTGAYHVGHAMTLDFESDKKTSGSGSTLGGYLFFPGKFSPSKKNTMRLEVVI